MVSLTGQKLLHLRWSRLLLVSFAALSQSDRLLPNRQLREMAKSTLPRPSPTSFTVSSVPFRALIHSRWCVCQVAHQDRKSTRLNSSHANISYAVFCLIKKNNRIAPVGVTRE